MKRMLAPALLLSLPIASIVVIAQPAKPVRVCVVGRDTVYPPVPAGQLNSSPGIRNKRDLVVKYVNQHKSVANNSFAIEAIALKSTSLAAVTSDANSAVCTYLVTIWSTGQARSEVDPLSPHSDSDVLSGTAPGFPPPAPLNSAIKRQQPAGWWNSLPEGSCNSSKMSIATDSHRISCDKDSLVLSGLNEPRMARFTQTSAKAQKMRQRTVCRSESAVESPAGEPLGGRLPHRLGKDTTQSCRALISHCRRNRLQRFTRSQHRPYDGHSPVSQVRHSCCSYHLSKVSRKASPGHSGDVGKSVQVPRSLWMLVHGHQSLRKSLIAQPPQGSASDKFTSGHVSQKKYQYVLGEPVQGRLPAGQLGESFFE